MHAPPEMQAYVWAAVAFFFFDRVFRVLRVLYANISLFHPSQKQGGLWACKAEFTPLPHDTTRITIRNPPISWSPGQHVFLSCQGIAPLQNHPFTIASIPEDGKMEFLVKAQSGGTRRFFKYAQKSHGLADTLPRYVLVLCSKTLLLTIPQTEKRCDRRPIWLSQTASPVRQCSIVRRKHWRDLHHSFAA